MIRICIWSITTNWRLVILLKWEITLKWSLIWYLISSLIFISSATFYFLFLISDRETHFDFVYIYWKLKVSFEKRFLFLAIQKDHYSDHEQRKIFSKFEEIYENMIISKKMFYFYLYWYVDKSNPGESLYWLFKYLNKKIFFQK
jgi:hypothetical protein